MSRPAAARTAGRLRGWREVLYVLAFYSVYTFVRNRGVATDSVATARRHALEVIDLERRLGAFWEEGIQEQFLDWRGFIQFWNIFYGTAHFVVTIFALVYLFRRMAHRYPLWRNTLACTTGLALIGFAFYPLMPPRLLDASFGFVDTLKEIGGLWSFDSGAVAKVSNQYAAMPSLHFAWSTWCALVLLPAVRRPWVRALVVAYPAMTLFAIVVTANHYWIDAAGGAATLGAGFLLGRAVTRALEARGRQPLPESVDDVPPAAPEPEPVSVGVPAGDAGAVPAGEGGAVAAGAAAAVPADVMSEGEAAPVPAGDAAPVPAGDPAPVPGAHAPVAVGDRAPLTAGEVPAEDAPTDAGRAEPPAVPEGPAVALPVRNRRRRARRSRLRRRRCGRVPTTASASPGPERPGSVPAHEPVSGTIPANGTSAVAAPAGRTGGGEG